MLCCAVLTGVLTGVQVVLVPGKVFLPDGGRSGHVRASFSVASFEDMDTALYRLRLLLLDEQRLREANKP